MIDMSKAIITVDTSEKTLAQIERDQRYHNAASEERRKMADEEQKAWDAKYLTGKFDDIVLKVTVKNSKAELEKRARDEKFWNAIPEERQKIAYEEAHKFQE